MTRDHRRHPPAPDPAATPGEQHAHLRERLAQLLGRLLARHWLRTNRTSATPAEKTEPESPRE